MSEAAANRRHRLDAMVVKAVATRESLATYVIRNMMSSPSDQWGLGFWRGLKTSEVLRACRRLEKRGLISEAPTSYVVMKSWRLAPPPKEARQPSPTGYDSGSAPQGGLNVASGPRSLSGAPSVSPEQEG